MISFKDWLWYIYKNYISICKVRKWYNQLKGETPSNRFIGITPLTLSSLNNGFWFQKTLIADLKAVIVFTLATTIILFLSTISKCFNNE